MKERPIIFSTPMVQAILNGNKTMTRRVVKPQPKYSMVNARLSKSVSIPLQTEYVVDDSKTVICPYGVPGDQLWVRETFAPYTQPVMPGINVVTDYLYKADPIFGDEPVDWNWKPSIYMPKIASRISLEIKSIGIQRIVDISNEDCIKEGIEEQLDPLFPNERVFKFYPNKDLRDETFNTNPKTSFYSLWESINGLGSWHSNPWVWVIEFKQYYWL